MGRPNLEVITHALTEKVIVENGRATGVAFRQHGEARTVKARREVILSAGAIGSPHILMLSGIGPEAQLRQFGISVVQHIAGVGQNLQDHYSAPIKLKARGVPTVNDVMLSSFKKVKAGLDYYLARKGPLTTITAPAAIFARTRPGLASPDIKCSISPFSADRPQDGLHPWSGFTMIAYQLRPESLGEITLKSANPADAPAMRPNYLATPTDQQCLVDGLKLCRRVLEQAPLSHLVESEYLPGPAVRTDAGWLEHARQTGGTVFHPTSTCKMGLDPLAVVDPELKVRGIAALRVADASVMPTVVSGNTNAASIMIGEKCADLLRQSAQRAAA
jgi:choline dehydrogenase